MSFIVEEIPNEDSLFYRLHKNYLREGEIIPGAFQAKGGEGMSTDWSRYTNAEQSLNRSVSPENNGIISLNVREVRNIEDLMVKHCPIEENQAHSEVYGIPEKGPFKTRIRASLLKIANWEIMYPR